MHARALPLAGPTYVVWGAGTDVGKTLISAAICNFVARAGSESGKPGNSVFYYKPVQTGFPEDSDADNVASVCGGHTEFGDHAGQLLAVSGDVATFPEIVDLDPTLKLDVTTRTEFAWSHPVSPHLAVQMEGRGVSDEHLVDTMIQQLATYSKEMVLKTGGDQSRTYTLVETAGAVNSPAPSGRSQADIFRAMRLPGILVGDGRLGGIASTMSAMESLILRGVDISCVIVHDKGFRNEEAIQDMMRSFKTYAGYSIPVFVLPPIPRRRTQQASSGALRSWILQCHDKLNKMHKTMDEDHRRRTARMAASSHQALTTLWWPFTQHDLVNKVTVIDSRFGEDWWVYKVSAHRPHHFPALRALRLPAVCRLPPALACVLCLMRGTRRLNGARPLPCAASRQLQTRLYRAQVMLVRGPDLLAAAGGRRGRRTRRAAGDAL